MLTELGDVASRIVCPEATVFLNVSPEEREIFGNGEDFQWMIPAKQKRVICSVNSSTV